MDLRNLPDGMTGHERCNERRKRIEEELDTSLQSTEMSEGQVGYAEEKNCEQMFGAVPLPVGYAGPLSITVSSQEEIDLHIPLATTEGALVASVNRGCKALSQSNVRTSSTLHGISRSMCLRVDDGSTDALKKFIEEHEGEWKKEGEATSNHLQILSHVIEDKDDYIFLTIHGNTDEAMGMNMITIAAQAIGHWVAKEYTNCTFITVAGNVDSDKKPSKRTHDLGRGYEVHAEVILSAETIETVLKTTPEAIQEVAKAKLETGSTVAGALGHNMHAANIIAAVYLATGQDAAHVVEGSLTDTTVEKVDEGLKVSVRCPAILIGIRGGGTGLPAQNECLQMLLKPKTSLHPCMQLAESIGAAVLAGEVSLLAAQASHTLAKAHGELGR